MGAGLRLAVRMLWKERSYAATAVLTLAICLGANVAIFTIVNSVLLRPLPVPDADRILLMANQYPNAGAAVPLTFSAAADYFDRLRDMTVFDEQAMYNTANFTFDVDGAPELVRGMRATPSLFRLLQVAPSRGRVFNEQEGEIGQEQAVILSHGLWQQAFGGSESILGRTIRMSGQPYAVVGVMPPGFQFADPDARFWIPLAFTDQQRSDDSRHSNNWTNVGRLTPDATIAQAQAEVDAINAANLDRFPQWREIVVNAGFHTRVERLQDVLVRDVRDTLYLLWGGAGLLLLIGALNIGSIALARSSIRARELSTRLALGASRAQVARQLVFEGLAVTFSGAGLGVLVSLAMLGGLRAIGLERIPRAGEIQMDLTVVGALLAVSAAVGVVIGLVPLVHLPTINLGRVLQEATRSGTGGRRTRAVRRALVVAEVGFAVVLLVGAGLLVASFRNLVTANPGFSASSVITAGITMPRVRYPEDGDIRRFTDRVLQTVRSVPGVVSAGATSMIPLGGNRSNSVIFAEGYQRQPGESVFAPYLIVATPGYFETMGTPIVQGRDFTDTDVDSALPVIVIDERLARRFWPDGDAIGKRMYNAINPREMTPNEQTRWLTVVGVVREVRLEDLTGRDDGGAYYFPAAQRGQRFLTLAMKTAGDPESVLRAVRTEIQKLDSELPLADVRTMTDYTARALMPRRAAMFLAAFFGVVSLFLAAVGIYGVLAYLVTQRAREIGIRMALGGTPRAIVELVLREGAVLVTAGAVLGIAGAAALRRALETQLYGLEAMDVRVFGAVLAVLAAIALAACSLPARRAALLDPVEVLSP